MTEQIPMLLGENEEVERGTYQIFRTDDEEAGEYISCEDLAFIADGSMADDLFGIAIVREIVDSGGQVLVVKHPLDEINTLV